MCVMRVSGPYDRLSVSLQGAFTEFREMVATRRLRERGEATERDTATFVCSVSDADGDHVPAQIDDAIAFLTENRAALAELLVRDGVEHAMLDFLWWLPKDAFLQWNRFPQPLLDLCVALGLELEVSVSLTDPRSKPWWRFWSMFLS